MDAIFPLSLIREEGSISLLVLVLVLDKLFCVLVDIEIKITIFDLRVVLPSNVAFELRLMEPNWT